MELVYMDGKKEPYTLSSIVAGVQDCNIIQLLKRSETSSKRFERFGKVGFKINAMESIRIQGLYLE